MINQINHAIGTNGVFADSCKLVVTLTGRLIFEGLTVLVNTILLLYANAVTYFGLLACLLFF